MDGHVIAHSNDLPAAIEYRAGVIPSFFDVGRKCRPAQRGAHFLGDGVIEVLEDLSFDANSAVRAFDRRVRREHPERALRNAPVVRVTLAICDWGEGECDDQSQDFALKMQNSIDTLLIVPQYLGL